MDKATNLNCGLHITDTQSGFRAFAKHTLPVFGFKSNGLAIESEMLMDASNAGLKIKEVEIGVRYDVDCSSENPVAHGLRVLVKILEDIELNRPLYYFTAPGMIFSIIGLAMGMKFLQDFYLGKEFDVRANSLDDNSNTCRIVHGFYRDHITFNGEIVQ